MRVDWPFLWAFIGLVGLLLAPIRYVTLQVAPGPAAWAVVGGGVVACFLVADWLERRGLARIGADPAGASTFVVLQFLVVPSIALAAVPAPETPFWLAVLPTLDPAATPALWFVVFALSISVTAWLSVYGGLARFGVDVAATQTFVFAWFSLALVAVFVAVLLGNVSRTPLTRTFVALEAVAAVVAYGPTRRAFTPNA